MVDAAETENDFGAICFFCPRANFDEPKIETLKAKELGGRTFGITLDSSRYL
jgi:hypothetical protein